MRVPRRVPAAVWVLGFVSLLMDVSSELIHSLLPAFMAGPLGASAAAIGLVEGVAEATASTVKVFSGTLSDFLGRRKELAVLGYGLGAASKPLFALAAGIDWVLGARFIDRIGKGLRGAPRDALVADLTPPEIRGEAFGLRQSLDTVGAFVGPLAAIGLMALCGGDFRRVFWFAVLPAAASVSLLALGVREPAASRAPGHARAPIRRDALKALGGAYWRIVLVGAVFTLARFSEAFLVLRALQAGLPEALAPAVFVVMNVVFSAAAYPAGRLADRVEHRWLLSAGLAALIAADLVLARAEGLGLVAAGVALWGLHMGLTQGLFATMVAATAPAELRGTAFGFFNLASGAAVLAASALAGLLWVAWGAPATFYAGAAFSAAAMLLVAGDSPRVTPT